MKTSKDYFFTKIEELMASAGMTAEKAVKKLRSDHPELIPPPGGQCFEDVVRANFFSGLSRTDSVKKAVTDHPALYADWLKRLPKGNDATKDLFPKVTRVKENLSATVDKKPGAEVKENLSPFVPQRKGILDFF